ncbi:hypothetical protein AWH62_09725 [Maricaulis sp. W15]|uniref:hypothetical protein n=1 Tax=Maricaulis sp. W15 TaxID=1772333 RepID=UPI0009491815|nr:hypothetical protein [Maricaulis sp. W15]OLF73205.1 hypothetical protein AWH62_09725 [Maricaulis sp. W15]
MPALFSPDGSIDAPLQALGLLLAGLLSLAVAGKIMIRGTHRLGVAGMARQFASLDILALVALVQLAALNLFDHTMRPLAGVFRPDVGDGGLIENLTILLMLFPVALVIDRARQRNRDTAFGPVSLAVTILVLVFAFGEEISWGQHWLGFTPPDAIAQSNLQEEFNLHNYITPSTMEAVYYALGITLIVLGARLGSLVSARHGDNVLLPLRALLILSGVLMCHHIFQELAELAVVTTGFLIWNRLDQGRLTFTPSALRTLAAI